MINVAFCPRSIHFGVTLQTSTKNVNILASGIFAVNPFNSSLRLSGINTSHPVSMESLGSLGGSSGGERLIMRVLSSSVVGIDQ